PVPDAVVDWLRESAVPLRTLRTGHGFSDMKPLAKLVKGAEVVALGEATHGSQEFYQAKGRLLEYLVAEHGFSVLTFEANWPESEALEHYVLTGQGDPRTALKRLKYFMWETEEALEVVEWMRAWNAKHPRKVRLIGVDVYLTEGSAARVVQFLSQVDAELLASKRKLLSRLQSQPFEQEDLDVEATLTALGEITSRLDERRAAYVGASSERAWGEARHAADLLVWAYQARKDPTARERGMASSVDWALAQAGPNAKAVYWAHNAHIERVSALTKRTGNFLAERKGARYRAIGALFGGGSFRAGDWTGSRSHEERTFSIGPAPLGSIESAFTRAGWPLAVVDLRKPAGAAAQRDAVTAWLAHPQTMREIGGAFVSEEAMQDDVLLSKRFDGVYFVQTTREATVLKQ
ncbi:MAG: erythromycin esterase family protein, partial [Myxococcales bacterium]|nr:erythromycin esterase family protein [Myxococcales bacterium]